MHFVNLPSAFAVIAVVATFAAGCGSSSPSRVSAGTYISSVCSAITPLEQDVVNRSSALKISPATNAAQAKKTLQTFLTAVAADSDHALSRIQAAGTPDIANGKAVAGTVVKAFTEVRDTLHTAVTKANSLPTSSPTAFKAAAQGLGTSVGASLSNIDRSGLSNPDLEKAAASQPACKSLTTGS